MTPTRALNTHRRALLHRRRALREDVRRRIQNGLAGPPIDVRDDIERSDASVSEDVDLALLQMKGETLRRIDEALGRLEHGTYGRCRQCDREIAEARLRALPFAVRCQTCEAGREQRQARTRQLDRQDAGFSRLPDIVRD